MDGIPSKELTLSEKLKRCGLTPEKLSSMLNVSKSTADNYFHGRYPPKLPKINIIVNYTDNFISYEDFLNV